MQLQHCNIGTTRPRDLLLLLLYYFFFYCSFMHTVPYFTALYYSNELSTWCFYCCLHHLSLSVSLCLSLGGWVMAASIINTVQSQFRRSQSEGPPHERRTEAQTLARAGTGTIAPARNQQSGLMAAWVGRRRQINDQQRPEHWFVAKPIVTTATTTAVRIRIHNHLTASAQLSKPNNITQVYSFQVLCP